MLVKFVRYIAHTSLDPRENSDHRDNDSQDEGGANEELVEGTAMLLKMTVW